MSNSTTGIIIDDDDGSDLLYIVNYFVQSSASYLGRNALSTPFFIFDHSTTFLSGLPAQLAAATTTMNSYLDSLLPHHHLPPPFRQYASYILMEDVVDADLYLILTIIALITLAFIQLKAFSRPPPVPLKRLPRRPALSILFKPDDISSLSASKVGSTGSQSSAKANLANNLRTFLSRSTGSEAGTGDTLDRSVLDSIKDASQVNSQASSIAGDLQTGGEAATEPTSTVASETFFVNPRDLPDSFAPLLSSSQTDLLLDHLTADLIHGVQAEAGLRMQMGRHEIPLDKDSSRPQLVLDVPKGGCRLTAVAGIGSDQFTLDQDLDVNVPTASRSCPMVKHAGIVFDPPLPLSNVAPTLIHFPTLFEDRLLPALRRIQLFRIVMDAIISISSFIEKCLWIVESILQIHLGQIRVTPVYKGKSSVDDITSPEWRLTFAFSGHLLLFGLIPIPFISVVLPTFIIPQPHALLKYLLTKQPLASARLRRENIGEQQIVLALIDMADTWNFNLRLVATPPAVGVDLTLPGGVSVGLEMMHGRDAGAGRSRQENIDTPMYTRQQQTQQRTFSSANSMSSWTTNNDSGSNMQASSRFRGRSSTPQVPFDANDLVPWSVQVTAKG